MSNSSESRQGSAVLHYRDPADLKRHKLHKQLPEQSTKDAQPWNAFVDAFMANGPDSMPPLTITKEGFVVDGWRRCLAARQLAWHSVPCIVRPESEAALIMVESLFGQRDMSRGAKVYFALALLPDYIAAAEHRRLDNVRRQHKTNENPLKPQCFSKSTQWTSEVNRDELCARWGVQKSLFHVAVNVRELLHGDPNKALAEMVRDCRRRIPNLPALQKELREEFEPDLISGHKGVQWVMAGIGGKLSTEDAERRDMQLDFWDELMTPFAKAGKLWKSLTDGKRIAIKQKFRSAFAELPPDLRSDLAQMIEEMNEEAA